MAVLTKISTLLVFLLCFSVGRNEGSKILIYPFGHCLNSHLLNAEKVAEILIANGHEVNLLVSTAYDGFAHKVHNDQVSNDMLSRVKIVTFPAPANYTPVCEHDTIDFMTSAPLAHRFDTLIHTFELYCESLLSTKHLIRNLKSQNFDLLIVESLDPCSRVLADYMDITFVPLITTGLGHWDGNPRPPSYVPAAISPFTSNMSFLQRLANLLMKTMYEIIPLIFGFDARFEHLKQKYDINTSLSISNTFSRSAIKLVNSDFAIDYPSPIEPDTVMIGGFAVDHNPPELSTELEEFMNSSGDDGVIVMSFGTLTKRFNTEWSKTFFETFAKLPQKTIMRYYPGNENLELMHLISNSTLKNKIKLMKWLPQSSLLAHPKTKLFISHCGLNGLFEMTHYGVPVVAVPMSGDHFHHAVKLTEHLQMGVSVDIFSLTSDKLYSAIQTVLNNDQYKNNAKEISRRIYDKPMTAATMLSWHVDYAIRHRGAPHLKSQAHTLTWIQYYSLDVIAFIGAFLIASLSTVCYIIIKIVSKMCKAVQQTLKPNKYNKVD